MRFPDKERQKFGSRNVARPKKDEESNAQVKYSMLKSPRQLTGQAPIYGVSSTESRA